MLGVMRLYQVPTIATRKRRAPFHTAQLDARTLELAALCVVDGMDVCAPSEFPLSRDMLEF